MQVHAPVPLMPWLQMPPMPHAHGWQVGPKKPEAHWLQIPPTATKPAGHDPAHVLLSKLSTWPGAHAVHCVAVVAQAVQVSSQATHRLPLVR